MFHRRKKNVSLSDFHWGKTSTYVGVGVAFVKCKMDGEKWPIIDHSVEEWEAQITKYCLLLPWIDDNEKAFAKEFAVVYDDWDVGDINHENILPGICVEEMKNDILH